MQMLLFQSLTRSLILLLFIIIGSLLDPAVIHFIGSLSKPVFITEPDSLNASVIISKNDSFLLHADIKRFDSLCLDVSIHTDGSFIVVIIPIQDSLTCFIVFNTDL